MKNVIVEVSLIIKGWVNFRLVFEPCDLLNRSKLLSCMMNFSNSFLWSIFQKVFTVLNVAGKMDELLQRLYTAIIYNACLLTASWHFFCSLLKKWNLSHLNVLTRNTTQIFFNHIKISYFEWELWTETMSIKNYFLKKPIFYVCTVFSPWNTKLKKAGFLWSHYMMRTVGTCLKKSLNFQANDW